MRYSPGLHRVIALFGAKFTGFRCNMIESFTGFSTFTDAYFIGFLPLHIRNSLGLREYLLHISLGFVTISLGLVISVLRYSLGFVTIRFKHSLGSYQKNKPNESENTFQIHWVCVHKIWCRFWHKMKPVIDETINKNSNA